MEVLEMTMPRKFLPCEVCGAPLVAASETVRERGVKRRKVIYQCSAGCWWCPGCKRYYRQQEQCNCPPCDGCGQRAYWACLCPSNENAGYKCLRCGRIVPVGETCLCVEKPSLGQDDRKISQ